PVREVAVFRDLHGAKDRQVDMPAADHRERIRRRKKAGGRQFSDRLLPGIDEIRILFPFIRERSEAEHAVLALQLYGHAVGNVVRNQRRNADAEIDVKAIAQFPGSALGHLLTGPRHQTSSPVPAAATRLRTVRCSMCLTAFGTCTIRLTY